MNRLCQEGKGHNREGFSVFLVFLTGTKQGPPQNKMQCKKVVKSALLPTAPRQASDPLLLSATAPSIDQAMADTQMVMSTDEHESSNMHVSARLRKRPESGMRKPHLASARCAGPTPVKKSQET